MKHISIDEYCNDSLSLFMFNIAMCGIFLIYMPDINTTHFGDSILLFIVKITINIEKTLNIDVNSL